MPVRVTSRIAYKEINEDGSKGRQSDRIYYKIVSCTSGGGYNNMSLREIKHNMVGIDINAISGRVNELKKDGKLKECAKRKCTVTNRLITPVRPYTMQEQVDKVLSYKSHYS